MNKKLLSKILLVLIITIGYLFLDIKNIYWQIFIQSIYILLIVFILFNISSCIKTDLKRGLFHYLLGALIGSFLIIAVVFILKIANKISLNQLAEPKWLLIYLAIPLWMLQSFAEEYLFRGLLFSRIKDKIGGINAVIISSLLFAALHGFNANFSFLAFINILLFGILCALIAYALKSIYLCSAIHFAWNFFQGSVFGINVSGAQNFESVYAYTPLSGKIFNGGTFGVEAGIVTTIILSLAILVAFMYLMFKKDGIIKTKKEVNYHVETN